MKKALHRCIWFLVVLAVCIFALSIILVLKSAPKICTAAVIVLIALQLAGLTYSLHSNTRQREKPWQRLMVFLLKLSAAGVALLLCFVTFKLAEQYHNALEVTPPDAENTVVAETEELYLLYPEYSTIELALGERPSREDQSITYCGAAVFQKRYNLKYDPAELCGKLVSHGEPILGYSLGGLGAFAFFNGEYLFANPSEAEEALALAAENGGTAFQQYLTIDDGVLVRVPNKDCRVFRALAELNGELCIIDSKQPMYYRDFAERMLELGVTHALYMDMGPGWNYSWYRDSTGKARTLIAFPSVFSHNWLVFRK